jgi:hypothetical protein
VSDRPVTELQHWTIELYPLFDCAKLRLDRREYAVLVDVACCYIAREAAEIEFRDLPEAA